MAIHGHFPYKIFAPVGCYDGENQKRSNAALLLGLPPIAAVEFPKVLLSENSRSRKLISLRPAGVVAPPGEGAVSFGYLSLGKQRKVTPTAGATRQQAKPE